MVLRFFILLEFYLWVWLVSGNKYYYLYLYLVVTFDGSRVKQKKKNVL